MPLQHAGRGVLARMKRGSSGAAFLRLLERIRRTIPEVMLRTSFIVGFPGETEADFRELVRFRARRRIRLDGRLRLFRRGKRGQPCPRRESGPRENRRPPRSLDEAAAQNLGAAPAPLRGPDAARLGRRAGKDTRAGLGSAPRRHGAGNRRQALPERPRTAIRRARRRAPGDMAIVEITASHDYDLVGRVMEVRESLPRSATPLASHAARQIPPDLLCAFSPSQADRTLRPSLPVSGRTRFFSTRGLLLSI